MGDFNVEVGDTAMLHVFNTFDRVSLIKEPLCNKNPEKPFWIDLILKNEHHSFQNSFIIEMGLSEGVQSNLGSSKKPETNISHL